MLGCVDGFNNDEPESERDECRVTDCRLLASERDAFEAFQLSESLLDPGASAVEEFGKETGFVLGVAFERNDGADPALSGQVTVGLGIIAFVGDDGAGLNLRADVE